MEGVKYDEVSLGAFELLVVGNPKCEQTWVSVSGVKRLRGLAYYEQLTDSCATLTFTQGLTYCLNSSTIIY